MRPLPPLNTLLLATFPYLLPTISAMPTWSTSPLPLLPLQSLREKFSAPPRPQPLLAPPENNSPSPLLDTLAVESISISVVLTNPANDNDLPPPFPASESDDATPPPSEDTNDPVHLLTPPLKFPPPDDAPPILDGPDLDADIMSSSSDLDGSTVLIAPAVLSSFPSPPPDPASSVSLPSASLDPWDPDCTHPSGPGRYHSLFSLSSSRLSAAHSFPGDYAATVSHAFHTLIPSTALQWSIVAVCFWLTICLVVGRWAGGVLKKRRERARLRRKGGGLGKGKRVERGGKEFGAGGYGGYGGCDKGSDFGQWGRLRTRDEGFEDVRWDVGVAAGGGVGGGGGLDGARRKSLGSLKRVWFDEQGGDGVVETVWLGVDDEEEGKVGEVVHVETLGGTRRTGSFENART